MNENLNLIEILKDCPKGIKLYSSVFGEVEFDCVKEERDEYPIRVLLKNGLEVGFTLEGTEYSDYYDGECVLFPSKDQRDWSKFRSKKPKFDPNTLNPFDKVLVRNDGEEWICTFFSHIVKYEETYPYACGYDMFTYCIPYNYETKYLVGTAKEAPEFYRYWED